MKLKFIILGLSLLYTNVSFNQADSLSLQEALLFFPLNLGNIWQYEYTHWDFGGDPADTNYYTLQIVDTSTQNSLIQYHTEMEDLAGNQIENFNLSLDTSTACTYYNNTLLDSLLSMPGDIFLGRGSIFHHNNWQDIYCWQLSPGNKIYNIYGEVDYILAKNLGTYYYHYIIPYAGTSGRRYKLIYAKINGVEWGTLVTSIDNSEHQANTFKLNQNYPNPFNPATTIKYQIPELSFVVLQVYDVLGNEIATLVNDEKPAGEYVIDFNASNLPSGIYFYCLRAGQYFETRKMVLLR